MSACQQSSRGGCRAEVLATRRGPPHATSGCACASSCPACWCRWCQCLPLQPSPSRQPAPTHQTTLVSAQQIALYCLHHGASQEHLQHEAVSVGRLKGHTKLASCNEARSESSQAQKGRPMCVHRNRPGEQTTAAAGSCAAASAPAAWQSPPRGRRCLRRLTRRCRPTPPVCKSGQAVSAFAMPPISPA